MEQQKPTLFRGDDSVIPSWTGSLIILCPSCQKLPHNIQSKTRTIRLEAYCARYWKLSNPIKGSWYQSRLLAELSLARWRAGLRHLSLSLSILTYLSFSSVLHLEPKLRSPQALEKTSEHTKDLKLGRPSTTYRILPQMRQLSTWRLRRRSKSA